MTSMNGSKTWSNLSAIFKRNPNPAGYYRLDPVISDLPALDDITKIASLKNLVSSDSHIQLQAKRIAQRLFASLFYFELTDIPRRGEQARFHIEGNMLCTRKCPDPALDQIYKRLVSSKLYIGGKQMACRVLRDKDGNIYLPVGFDNDEIVGIEIKEKGVDEAFPISGSPLAVQMLIRESGFIDHFGTRTHKRKNHGVNEGPHKRRRITRNQT